MKKIIIAAIIGLTCVGGGVTTAVVTNSPEYVMSNAISDVVEDFLERDDISTIVDILDQGSVAVDCKVQENIAFSGKMYFGLSDSKLFVEDVKASIKDGESTMSVTGSAYLSEDMFYVQNAEYLDGAYGIKLKNLSEQFKNSIFYNASGEDNDYALPEEVKKMVEEYLDYYENDYQNLQKDSEKLYKKYAKQFGKLVKKYGEFDSENEKVSLVDGESTKRVVTLELDDKAIASIIKDLINYVIDDEDFEKFVKTHVKNLDELMAGFVVNEYTPDEMYDEIIDTLEEVAGDIDDSIEDDIEIKVKVVTPKASTKLLKIELEIEDGYDESSIAIDFGSKGVKKSEHIAVLRDDEKVCSYEIKENSKNKFEVKFTAYDTVYNKNKELLNATYELDKENEKFTIKAVADEIELLSIKGTAKIDGKSITFKPTECVVKHEEDDYDYDLGEYVTRIEEVNYFENIDLEIVISTKDKMPKPNKDFKNILEMKEEDIDKIIDKFEGMI